MRSIKEKRGITLIALAVTIVVLLILAAVTITFVLGEDGVINKAKEASNAMNNAAINDQASLNSISDTINGMVNRTEGSGDSNTEAPDPDPELPKLEDTTGIQDETVQVEDEYGNKVTIPKGFEVVEEEGTTVPEGIVIQDKDGNQFVWIPVGRVYKDNTGTNYSDIQLGRYTFDEDNGTPTPVQYAYTEESPENYKQEIKLLDEGEEYIEYATRENSDGIASSVGGLNAIAKDLAGFVNSVRENGGYYLGRYEASYGSGNNVEEYKPLSKVSTSIRNSGSTLLKQGMLWNWVTQIDAAKISRNMYNNDSSVGVESDLINSYAWDTAIVFIQAMGNGNENYANKPSETGWQVNTGTTGDEVCNINDMAFNSHEWSTEYSTETVTYDYCCVARGGSHSRDYNTAYRYNNPCGFATNKDSDHSFRVTLYVK